MGPTPCKFFFQESDSMQSLKLKTQFDIKLDTTEKINFLDKSENIQIVRKKKERDMRSWATFKTQGNSIAYLLSESQKWKTVEMQFLKK